MWPNATIFLISNSSLGRVFTNVRLWDSLTSELPIREFHPFHSFDSFCPKAGSKYFFPSSKQNHPLLAGHLLTPIDWGHSSPCGLIWPHYSAHRFFPIIFQFFPLFSIIFYFFLSVIFHYFFPLFDHIIQAIVFFLPWNLNFVAILLQTLQKTTFFLKWIFFTPHWITQKMLEIGNLYFITDSSSAML